MSEIGASDEDILLAQRIISAAERHDLQALKVLLKNGSANVRDPASGSTPLHAAIAKGANQEDTVARTVEFLLQNGAIWNDLNNENETPGCIALKLGLKNLYDIMVDAGVRAEMLFGKMHDLGLDEDEDGPNGVLDEVEPHELDGVAKQEPLQEHKSGESVDDVSLDNHAYLQSNLRFKPGILLDSSDNAVMMDWEKEIMTRHAQTLLPKPGLRSMNVGHGLGIVDRAILDRSPSMHHIVEAHPQVLQRLRDQGWYEKPTVTIHEGRWQDVFPKMAEEGIVLDAIYYDTFAEDYYALKEFFSEWVIQFLDSAGKFGWYNGLGADRQICYDVYTKVSAQCYVLC